MTIVDKNLEAIARALRAKIGRVDSLWLYHNPEDTAVPAGGERAPLAAAYGASLTTQYDPGAIVSPQPEASGHSAPGFADIWESTHTNWGLIKSNIDTQLRYHQADEMPSYDGGAGQIRLRLKTAQDGSARQAAQLEMVLWPRASTQPGKAQDYGDLVSGCRPQSPSGAENSCLANIQRFTPQLMCQCDDGRSDVYSWAPTQAVGSVLGAIDRGLQQLDESVQEWESIVNPGGDARSALPFTVRITGLGVDEQPQWLD
jgi:hypothetical protein